MVAGLRRRSMGSLVGEVWVGGGGRGRWGKVTGMLRKQGEDRARERAVYV